jgi:hypothetical protein
MRIIMTLSTGRIIAMRGKKTLMIATILPTQRTMKILLIALISTLIQKFIRDRIIVVMRGIKRLMMIAIILLV